MRLRVPQQPARPDEDQLAARHGYVERQPPIAARAAGEGRLGAARARRLEDGLPRAVGARRLLEPERAAVGVDGAEEVGRIGPAHAQPEAGGRGGALAGEEVGGGGEGGGGGGGEEGEEGGEAGEVHCFFFFLRICVVGSCESFFFSECEEMG